LGIAGTTVTFGVIDALFLRPPAGVVDADRLARLLVVRDEGGTHSPAGSPSSYRDFEGIRDGSDSFLDVAAYTWPQMLDFDRGENASQVQVSAVSGNFFSLLGVVPAAGRLFIDDDGRYADSPPAAVLSHSFWSGRLGGDPAVVGRQILIKGKPVTVLGVARKGFIGTGMEAVDVWVTSSMASDLGLSMSPLSRVTAPAYSMIGRLRPGVSRERAAAEAQAHVYVGTEEDFLDPTPGLEVIPLSAASFPGASSYARTTLWLGGASFFLLLIACSSVGNMLLARVASRGRELAVRSALGAERGRLMRQLLTESLLLALLGGVVAILLTVAAGGVIRRFDLPPGVDELHFRVLGFALFTCLLTALLTGLLPAVKVLPRSMASRLGTKLHTGSLRRSILRKALVGFQVGIACILLVGAAIFLRSFLRVMAVEPGFDPERVMVVSMDFAQISYGAADIEAFQNDAMERLEGLPGVEASTRAFFVPLHGSSIRMAWDDLEGNPIPYEQGPLQNYVTPEYFRTMGTGLISAESDFVSGSSSENGTGTVVVSASMAKLMAPDGKVVGECLRRHRIGGCLRIVGVAEDIRYRYLDDAVTPMLYILSDEETDVSAMGPHSLLVRTSDSSPATAAQIRSAVQTLRPGLPYINVDPLEDRVRTQTSTYRLGSLLSSIFGGVALLLALIGTYGVLSYFVTERAPEFGIRRSIGAPAGAILRVTMREGFSPVVVGLAIGLTVAAFGAKFLQPLLFQTSATDPLAFAGVAVVLCVGGLAAVLIPTGRLLRADPGQSVRAE
jgi:predicted permease